MHFKIGDVVNHRYGHVAGPLADLQPAHFTGHVVTQQDSIRTVAEPTGPATRAWGPHRGARLCVHGGQGEREMLEMRRAAVLQPGSIPAATRRQDWGGWS